jgi:hypothetical protein
MQKKEELKKQEYVVSANKNFVAEAEKLKKEATTALGKASSALTGF